jgi:hypothetical protein
MYARIILSCSLLQQSRLTDMISYVRCDNGSYPHVVSFAPLIVVIQAPVEVAYHINTILYCAAHSIDVSAYVQLPPVASSV